jgi:hypothetical protein
MHRHRCDWTLIAVTLLAAALFGSVAIACNVPVFRYALERWPADQYEIVILHAGPLDPAEQALLERLRESGSESSSSANFNVRTIDPSEAKDPLLQALWSEQGGSGAPLLVALYPRGAQEVPDRLVSAGPLSEEAVAQLIDSPVRQQLVAKLLAGDSAVWIFVPSGHGDQDDLALATLKTQVQRNQDELELPPQEELEADEFFRPETPIELRLGFSIVTLDRHDPKEKFLLHMLLGSEPDLEGLDQPMAFPVIGRGRVLYALVGKGIFRDTIAMASEFVVGPCSCQVKEQNPGFDLLLAVNWDEKLGGSVLSEVASERLTKPILLTIPPGK